MNRIWLLPILSMLACDEPLGPRAQPWTVETAPDSASLVNTTNEFRKFSFQESSESALASFVPGNVGYVFEITDYFYQQEKPSELRYLSGPHDADAGIETVWLRLPKEVFGFEAAFECPATSLQLYSRVRVALGIEVSCTVHTRGAFLTIVFSNVEEHWDHTNPRIAIGLTPDAMLYEWRLKTWEDGDFPGLFYFAYKINATWVEDSTYGGYRL